MEEKKVNLEGIFYDAVGNFIPLDGNHGNADEEVSLKRDVFMTLERDRFEELMADAEIRELFTRLIEEKDANELALSADYLMEQLETGELETYQEKEDMKLMTPEEQDEYHMKKLEKAENLLILLEAAIQDYAKIKILTKEYSTSKSR